MKQNIGRGEFSQFPNLSQTSCQEDDGRFNLRSTFKYPLFRF
ncbi:unnamed protein product [Acanthoscelides obtectus]|uniref:Uncharacterized protein n=1 Tax=Acanthoscelides obtectus TaxID=200917 RepID=A0A9P0L0Q0_ACAOB|nr:unnamed protein product [Acanthoscelides obtectus]CAK1620453.1 hypothetical protein AOBTE_LOCUS382 [Acanthoscelides obtectus]